MLRGSINLLDTRQQYLQSVMYWHTTMPPTSENSPRAYGLNSQGLNPAILHNEGAVSFSTIADDSPPSYEATFPRRLPTQYTIYHNAHVIKHTTCYLGTEQFKPFNWVDG
jgi:hypothetical protein